MNRGESLSGSLRKLEVASKSREVAISSKSREVTEELVECHKDSGKSDTHHPEG